MEFKDYYEILGVEPDADTKAIKTAYRKLARKYHPDVSDHHEAESKFKVVVEAYEVLKSADKRAEFDQIRQYGSHGQFDPPPQWQSSRHEAGPGSAQSQRDFSDFFSSIFGAEEFSGQSGFGQRRPGEQKGQDIETELPIFLEESVSDESKKISYELPHYELDGQATLVKKTLNVKIPAGVQDGERIRLKGQGAPGMGDSPNGDLYLRIRLVPHPLFDVEGNNLLITVPLAPWEAALGAKVRIPTLSGHIDLSIPANSQTGARLRIKDKGLIYKKGRGDLYAILNVVMPDASNAEAKEQWELLSRHASFDPRSEWSQS
jgi:curved DNA-binding protein